MEYSLAGYLQQHDTEALMVALVCVIAFLPLITSKKTNN